MAKSYRLTRNDMVQGLANDSTCFATDRITIDGAQVRFMYRDRDGWNFFAGDETQQYVDDPGNLGVFALNDIANYDRAILPYLNAAAGTAWVRQGDQFVEDPQGAPADDPNTPATPLDPQHPIVEGVFALTKNWSISLPQPMNRRIDDGAMVLWRPGITAWILIWGNPEHEPVTARLSKLRTMSSPNRYNEKEWPAGELVFHTYRLDERSGDRRQLGLYGNVIGPSGHVQITVYFDDEADADDAAGFIGRIGPNGPQTRSSLSLN